MLVPPPSPNCLCLQNFPLGVIIPTHMAHEYKVTLGEMRSGSEHFTSASQVGEFVISFTVEPPVKFISEQAAAEMGHHVMVAWNAIGKNHFPETGKEKPGLTGNEALVSFSHEIGEGDARATKGIISGYYGSHSDYFDQEALQQAFDLVLNGD